MRSRIAMASMMASMMASVATGSGLPLELYGSTKDTRIIVNNKSKPRFDSDELIALAESKRQRKNALRLHRQHGRPQQD